VGIYAVLIAANLSAWAWALIAFAHQPILLGTALLAYSLGLRHALDADHIAAIDNVTRKLMQEGKRPLSVGLFFSLGHSTVVALPLPLASVVLMPGLILASVAPQAVGGCRYAGRRPPALPAARCGFGATAWRKPRIVQQSRRA